MADLRHRVVVDFNEKWMQRQSLPGGSIYDTSREATGVAVAHVRSAVRANHRVTGKMGNSFRVDMNRRDRANVFGIIRCSVPYAKFFFFGTNGPITGKPPGSLMYLRPGSNGRVFAVAREVAGQSNKEHILEAAVAEGIRNVT